MRTFWPPALRRFSAAVLSTALLSLTLLAQQQQPPPPADSQVTIRVGVDVVNVLTTVRDAQRRLVPDLEKEEFRIFEDGQEQKIEFFSREVNQPITLGVAMDTSISMAEVLGRVQESGVRFLRRVMKPGDLAFVTSFDMNVDLLGDLSSDLDRLESAVGRARINAPLADGPVSRRGPTGTKLYDAVVLTCEQKLAREAGRKVLVLLTDAYDAGSYYTQQQAIEAAQRSNTVIHVVFITDPQRYASDERAARKLAEETGGRVVAIRDPRRLDEAFDQISEEIRSQYVLGYYPSNRVRDGAYRRLKVDSTRRGMRILARKGYYAPKD